MTIGLLATQPPRASIGLLRHADFLRLWTGQTGSRFGSQVSPLAIPLVAITMRWGSSPAHWARRPSRRGSGSGIPSCHDRGHDLPRGGLLAVLTIVFSPVRSLRTIADAIPADVLVGAATPREIG